MAEEWDDLPLPDPIPPKRKLSVPRDTIDPVPEPVKKKGGRPKGSKTRTPIERLLTSPPKGGDIVVRDKGGKPLVRIANDELCVEVLKEFGGYEGLARSLRWLWEKSGVRGQSKVMQMIFTLVNRSQTERQDDHLTGMSQKQLEAVFRQKVAELTQRGILDDVIAHVKRKELTDAEAAGQILEVEARVGADPS